MQTNFREFLETFLQRFQKILEKFLRQYGCIFQDKRPIKKLNWIAGPVKFFVNTEGCGYPPRINCSEFAKRYGWDVDRADNVFPCYYSKRYPFDRAVASFDWDDTIKNLALAIGVPNLLFALSVAILSYWYCWPNFHYDRRARVMLGTTYTAFDSSEDVEEVEGLADNGNLDTDAITDTSPDMDTPNTPRDSRRQ